jgi:hypothetical protein
MRFSVTSFLNDPSRRLGQPSINAEKNYLSGFRTTEDNAIKFKFSFLKSKFDFKL